jgi:hypothetical protein
MNTEEFEEYVSRFNEEYAAIEHGRIELECKTKVVTADWL